MGLTRDGKEDIWVKQLPTGPFSRITFGDTGQRASLLVRGRPLGDSSSRGGAGGLPYARLADGTGAPRAVARPSISVRFCNHGMVAGWSLRGSSREVAGTSMRPGWRHDLDDAGRHAGDGDVTLAVTRRALAGVLVWESGDLGGLRSALSRDRNGPMAGVHGRRNPADSGPETGGSCISSTARAISWRWRSSRRPVSRSVGSACSSPRRRTRGGTGIQAYDVHPDGRRFIFLGERTRGRRAS